MAAPTLQAKHSSVDDQYTVHTFDRLLNELVDEMTETVFQEFMVLSNEQLGAHGKEEIQRRSGRARFYEYFNVLKDKLGVEGRLQFLINLMDETKFHGKQGSYKTIIEDYYQGEYLISQAAGKSFNENLVGRYDEQSKVVDLLRQQTHQGIVLCGMPGMGKTSLAHQICFTLTTGCRDWKVIDVNLRGKTEFEELMVDLICKMRAEINLDYLFMVGLDIPDLIMRLQTMSIRFGERSFNYLILLDDLDDFCGNPEKLAQFQKHLNSILYSLSNCTNIKFLLTTSTKLSAPNDRTTREGFRLLFNGSMVEMELKRLSDLETKEILHKGAVVQKQKLTDEVCQKICTACDGNALAIQFITGLLAASFPIDLLMNDLQATLMKKYHTSVFFNKSFEHQDESLQKLMACLTVFETERFDLSSAVAVMGSRADKKVLDSSLSLLAVYHWLEKYKDKLTIVYCLHSLVFNFLMKKCDNAETLKQEKKLARLKFLKYLCKEMIKCGEKYRMLPCTMKKMLDQHDKTEHVKKFFITIIEDNISLLDIMPEPKYQARIAQMKIVWLVAEFSLTPNVRRQIARQQANLVAITKDLYLNIYWRAQEANCFLPIDRPSRALEKVDSIFEEFKIVNESRFCCEAEGWQKCEHDEIPAVGLLYMVKGWTYLDLGMKGKNPDQLKMAMTYLDKVRELFELGYQKVKKGKGIYPKYFFSSERAAVENLIGCIYFEQKDYTAAAKCQEKALKIEEGMADLSVNNPKSIEYRANIAATLHQLGLNTKIKHEREAHLKKALEMYDKCVKINKDTENVTSPAHACLLQNRAEIYYKQQELERALKEGKEVLDILKKLHTPPHMELTIALDRVGHYQLKLGKRMKSKDNNPVEGIAMLQASLETYEDIQFHIRKGGLPLANTDDIQLYKDLLEQLKLGLLPAIDGTDKMAVEKILKDMQKGKIASAETSGSAVYTDVVELVKQKKFEHSGNRRYRHIKENHHKLMQLLCKSKKEISAKRKQYEEYEMGACNVGINRNLQYEGDFNLEQFLAEAKANGAQYNPDPGQSLEPGNSFSDNDNDETDDATSSSSGDGDFSPMNDQLEMAEARIRRDSGVSDTSLSDSEIPMDESNEIIDDKICGKDGDVNVRRLADSNRTINEIEMTDSVKTEDITVKGEMECSTSGIADEPQVKLKSMDIDEEAVEVFQVGSGKPEKAVFISQASRNTLCRQLSVSIDNENDDQTVSSDVHNTPQTFKLVSEQPPVEERTSKITSSTMSGQPKIYSFFTVKDKGTRTSETPVVPVVSSHSVSSGVSTEVVGQKRKLSSAERRTSWRKSSASFTSVESEAQNPGRDSQDLQGSFDHGGPFEDRRSFDGHGQRRRSSASISRQQWSSAGSQDSVTSKIGTLFMQVVSETPSILGESEAKIPKTEDKTVSDV